LPAFICDIFFPIFQKYNIKPVFLDIDLKTFNIKIEEIEKKVTANSRAILICHTYGLAVDIEKVKSIIRDRLLNLFIIEDCAHSLGNEYKGKFVGNFSDLSFFSLYKQFPTFRGGMVILSQKSKVKSQKEDLPKTHFNFRDFISFLNCFSPFAFLFKSFGTLFGQKIMEKTTKKEKFKRPAQINKVSLNLFQYFLKENQENLKKRINLALFFQKELEKLGFEVQESENNVFCYLSALIAKNLENKRDQLVKKLRKYHIFCTRIWKDPIILNQEVQKEYNLNLNDYPNTIEAAKRIINFPLQNYYTEKDIKKMMVFIKKTIANL
jgi:dTDP-4-amino-4,6-dideoxygalactose transaminase